MAVNFSYFKQPFGLSDVLRTAQNYFVSASFELLSAALELTVTTQGKGLLSIAHLPSLMASCTIGLLLM